MKCTCRPRDQCENCFAAQVREYADLNGWLVYQTPTWRKTAATAGFVDMVLVNESGRLIMAELKRDHGFLSGAQEEWLKRLLLAPCEYYTWRPYAWPEIESRLRRPDRGPRLEPREYDKQPQ
jgi:hypothetical protein